MSVQKWILLLLVGVGWATAADETMKTQPVMLRIKAEWFAMSGDTCSKLLDKNRSGGDAVLREEVTALVAQGEAKLFDLASGTTRPGLPVQIASVQEFIHPTEADPDANRFQTSSPEGEPFPPAQLFTFNAFPTGLILPAYDTRELGSRLQADLVLRRDGRTIAATVTPSWTALSGWESLGKYKDANAEVEMRIPRFGKLYFRSEFVFTDGAPMLVSVLSPSTPEGVTDPSKKLLVFIRVDVLRLPE